MSLVTSLFLSQGVLCSVRERFNKNLLHLNNLQVQTCGINANRRYFESLFVPIGVKEGAQPLIPLTNNGRLRSKNNDH